MVDFYLPLNSVPPFVLKRKHVIGKYAAEKWVEQNVDCVECGGALELADFDEAVYDLECKSCKERYQVKAMYGKDLDIKPRTKKKFKLTSAAYKNMYKAIQNGDKPHYFIMKYLYDKSRPKTVVEIDHKYDPLTSIKGEVYRTPVKMSALYFLDKKEITEDHITKRVLSETAQRAGHVMSDVMIDKEKLKLIAKFPEEGEENE